MGVVSALQNPFKAHDKGTWTEQGKELPYFLCLGTACERELVGVPPFGVILSGPVCCYQTLKIK